MKLGVTTHSVSFHSSSFKKLKSFMGSQQSILMEKFSFSSESEKETFLYFHKNKEK